MNNLVNQFIIVLAAIVSFAIVCQAQTTLSAGDIAIVGFNANDPDEFAFVTLVDISIGTQIKFTDAGWLDGGGFYDGGEGALQFNAASSYNAGEVIIYSGLGGEWATYSVAPLDGTFDLGTSGDQIIAFQGTATSPTPIVYAINFSGPQGTWQKKINNLRMSALPTGLVNGYTAVALFENDNGYYSGGPNSDLNALRSFIGNNSSWTMTNTRNDLTTIFADPLPVELSSFSATIKNNTIILNWKTETEVNNYGFEVLRQAQDDEWDVLGFVEGNGNSNSPKEYSFIDNEVNSAGTYSYRLKQIDNDGTYEFSKSIEVEFSLPTSSELNQNYPNPFNPTTTISFTLPNSGMVTLKVFNTLGEEVVTLANGFREAGVYTFNFNAIDLPSGTYFYQFKAASYIETKKMVLMK